MGTTKNKITPDNIDEFLAISGYIFQSSEEELRKFDILYEDYELKNKDFRINPDEIIGGTFKKQGRVFSIKDEENEDDVNQVRMAARKANEEIPQSILDKMKRRHRDGNK